MSEEYTKSESNSVVKIIKDVVIALIAVILVFGTFGMVGAGHRGVMLNFGAVQDKVLGEGFYIKIPIAQKVVKIDVRTVKMEVQALSYSRDIQIVDSTIALNYHLSPKAVNKLYQEIGLDFESRIISPAIQESVKATIANYTAQELVEKRGEVKDGIKVFLTERLLRQDIIVDELSIVNFDFSDTYEAAIEAKQVAQQEVLTAKNKLERVKFEAEQRIAQAKGEAEAIKIQVEAITQQGGKDYVNLKWVEAWGSGLAPVPQTLIGEGSGSFLFNLNSK